MSTSKYDVKRLDHLGLVAGFCKEIGLTQWVDAHFPKESHHSHITNGQLFVAMLLNGLLVFRNHRPSLSTLNGAQSHSTAWFVACSFSYLRLTPDVTVRGPRLDTKCARSRFSGSTFSY